MLGRLCNGERGHAVLYAVLVIPFAFLLTAAAVDISGWNATRDKLQQEADRLAFQGLGGLPNGDEVRARVEQAAAELISQGIQAEVFFPGGTSRSAVGVRLSSQYQPRFGLFSAVGLGSTYGIKREGVAQVVPGDFVIIVADGATLRPPLEEIPTAPVGSYNFPAWGNPIEWPASPYFNAVKPRDFGVDNPLAWSWAKDWFRPEFQRWATQSCFNPVVTPLKLAAIGLSEALLDYGVNRIGFFFTPGEQSTRGFRAVRHVHGADDQAALYPNRIGGFPPNVAEVRGSWGNYLELQQFLGDEVCYLISNPQTGFSSYEFPGSSLAFSASCPNEPPPINPIGHFHSSTSNVTNCYANEKLLLREAIYWNAVKLKLPNFAARPNIIASLQEAWTELTDDRTLKLEQVKRGNLAHNSLRQVMVLTDFLPDPSSADLQQLLADFQLKHIQVSVAAFVHEGLGAADNQLLRDRTAAWQALGAAFPKVLRVTLSEDAVALQRDVVPQFLASALHFALRT